MDESFEDLKHYSHLATYLINEDDSGLTKQEIQEADTFIKSIKKFYGLSATIVDCDDNPEFAHPTYGGLKGEVITYTIRFNPKELPEEHWDLPRNMTYLYNQY